MLLQWWQVGLLLLLALPVRGQQPGSYVLEQRKINTADGLSAEAIQDVFRDSLGFYWIADAHALFCFDGQQISKYDFRDLRVPADDYLSFVQDKKGLIWIAAQHGQYSQSSEDQNGSYSVVQIFDPYSRTILPEDYVNALLPCATADIFRFCSDGDSFFLTTNNGAIYQYEEEHFNFLYREEKTATIRSVTWSSFTQKYYWADRDDLYEWDGKGASRYSRKLSFFGFNLAVQEDILIVSLHRGKHVFPSQVELLALSPTASPQVIANFPKTLLVSHGQRDSIWLSNEAGLQLLVRCEESAQLRFCPSTRIDSPMDVSPENATGATRFDQTFWLFFPRVLLAVEASPSAVETIQWKGQARSIRDIAQANDSLLLLTTYGGAQRVNLASKEVTPTLPEIGKGGYTIHDAGDHWYVGRHSSSFIQVDQAVWVAENRFAGRSFDDVRSNALHAITDQSDNIWIGTNSGLLYHTIEEGITLPFTDTLVPSFGQDMICQIVADETGVWVGSASGAFLIDPKTKCVLDSFTHSENHFFESVYPLSEDSIWLIPKSGNPILWERNHQRLTHLDLFRPRLGNSLHTILRDEVGAFWLPSNYGLYRYDPETGRVLQLLQEEYSLPENEFNQMAWEVLSDGRIAFGTVDGLCIVDPKAFANTKEVVAPLHLSEVAYSRQDEDEITKLQLIKGTVAQLPSDLDRLRIRVSQATPFQRSLRYFYRLDAKDDQTKWELLPGAELNLERLRPGAHYVDLAVKEEFDQKFQALTSWSFSIEKRWYQQTWFYALLTILAYVLLSQYMRYRLAVANSRQAELEEVVKERTAELEQERSLIARQNEKLQQLDRAKDRLYALITHEIKGPLLGVLGLSKKIDFLLQKNRPEDVKTLSRKIDQNARQVSLLLDNMISWGKMQFDDQQTSSGEQLDIVLEIQRIIVELEDLASRKKLGFKVDVEDAETLWFDRQAFIVIMRNILHNAVKFSHYDQTIKIQSCSTAEDAITISVINKGIALPEGLESRLKLRANIISQLGTAKEQGSGIGLSLCTELARRNDAQLTFTSLENQQTKVEFHVFFKSSSNGM